MKDSEIQRTSLWTSCFAIAQTNLRRFIWTWQTVLCFASLVLLCVLAVAWSQYRQASTERFIREFYLTIYVSAYLPLVCLCYGTASLGNERENQTLVYLLQLATGRGWIYLAKFVSTLLFVLGWTCGGIQLVLLLSGVRESQLNWALILPVFLGTTAYVALFHLQSVLFRYATVVAIMYAIFLETLVGNMPGTGKRIAVSFFVRCLAFETCERFGIPAAGGANVDIYQPIGGTAAMWTLVAASALMIAAGMLIFRRREYV